jgi:hypothetical protein
VAGIAEHVNNAARKVFVPDVREQGMMEGHAVQPINVIASEARQSIAQRRWPVNGLLRRKRSSQ